jgi:hypothetical protein
MPRAYTFPYSLSAIISLYANVPTFLLIFKLAFSIPQSAFGTPHFPIIVWQAVLDFLANCLDGL